MLLKIQKWAPKQMTLFAQHERTYDCVLVAIDIHSGGNSPILNIALKIAAGPFRDRLIHVSTPQNSALSRELFEAIGIPTANGIVADTNKVVGRRLAVNVTCASPRMMYNAVVGFLPAVQNPTQSPSPKHTHQLIGANV